MSHKNKNTVCTTITLDLLHLDLFDCNTIKSLNGSRYCLVIIDDYTRYAWTFFLKHKDETIDIFISFSRRIENEKNTTIKIIRSDHRGEFQNTQFKDYYLERGYRYEFFVLRTPQQNGVVERKNRALQEAARSMLNEYVLPSYFWVKAVSTTCYVQNRVLIHIFLGKTSHELWFEKSPTVKHLRVFGCKVFILNTKDHLGKFTAKVDEDILVGYSLISKVYRIYNKRSKLIEESPNVVFEEVEESGDT